MNKTILWTRNNKLTNWERLHSVLNALDERRDHLITTQLYTPELIRTERQRRYLGAIIGVIIEHRRESGFKCYEHDVWKKFFSVGLWGMQYDEHPNGKSYEYIRPTSKLSTKLFSEYIEHIRWYARDELNGLYIKTPEEYYQDKTDKRNKENAKAES